MATYSFSFETGVVPLSRFVDAICLKYNYNPATDGTKAQFARLQVKKFIESAVVSVEADAASASAVQTAITNAPSLT